MGFRLTLTETHERRFFCCYSGQIFWESISSGTDALRIQTLKEFNLLSHSSPSGLECAESTFHACAAGLLNYTPAFRAFKASPKPEQSPNAGHLLKRRMYR